MFGQKKKLLAGKYELLDPVGQGGMASVWQAITHGEAGFKRRVAIKRVLRHLTKDEKFEAMFVEEARVVADLNHPNIVQIHDFGRDRDGGYFIVMEWIEGVNLEGYVRSFALVREQPPWMLASAIAIEALRALSAAHQRVDSEGRPVPVIHRDVAPANILIGVNGSVKLADFGLSRAMDRPSRTDPGIVKGKVSYMAPECLEGAKPSTLSDIYAIGVVLWESLAARNLFGGSGTDVDIAMRVMKAEIPPLGELREGLPERLVDIVECALSRNPKNRFARATDMIDALAGLLRNQTMPTDGPTLAKSVRLAMERLPKTEPGLHVSSTSRPG